MRWLKKLLCVFSHRWSNQRELDGWVWATCSRCKEETSWLAKPEEMPVVTNSRDSVTLSKWAYCPKCDIEFIGNKCVCGYVTLVAGNKGDA